ncbi:MAG: hypothetical protein ACOX8S_03605 [Christensenellales bacterium]
MVKRRKNGSLFLFIISCATLALGVFFIVDIFDNFMAAIMVFAAAMLVIGVAYLAFYSLSPGVMTAEWPIIEGLTDVLLAIVLFMSMNTAKTDMILYILSIWALAGATSRVATSLKLSKNVKRQAFFNAGACLVAAIVIAGLTIFTQFPPQIIAGAGIIIYSFGSFVSPRRAFFPKSKQFA